MKLQTVMFSMIIFVELLSLSCERAICYQANAGLLLLEGGGLLLLSFKRGRSGGGGSGRVVLFSSSCPPPGFLVLATGGTGVSM